MIRYELLEAAFFGFRDVHQQACRIDSLVRKRPLLAVSGRWSWRIGRPAADVRFGPKAGIQMELERGYGWVRFSVG